jgi:N-methylhydantoinase A
MRSAFMRYCGQGREIALPAPARPYRPEDAGELWATFEEAYCGLYSRVIPGVEVEVLSWVLLLSGPVPAGRGAPAALAPGAMIPGPAVIVEDETSTVVSRSFEARIDARCYI